MSWRGGEGEANGGEGKAKMGLTVRRDPPARRKGDGRVTREKKNNNNHGGRGRVK